jgi:peptidoglycan hydrolase-like protein with peptidoglycan-binding domain
MKGRTSSKWVIIALFMIILMLLSTPAFATAKPTGKYQITDRGSNVKLIQQQLVTLGYMESKNVTGYYGELTQSAIKKFQKDSRLTADGIAGTKTLNALFDVKIDTSKSYKLEDEGENVKALQRLLINKGYLGSKYATGYYGSLTMNAVKKFQKDNKLTADGIAGKKTLAKLMSSSSTTGSTTSTTIKTYIANPGTLRLGDKGKL